MISGFKGSVWLPAGRKLVDEGHHMHVVGHMCVEACDGHQAVEFPRGEMTMVLTKEGAVKMLRMVRWEKAF